MKEVLVRNADYASILGDARQFVEPGLDRVHVIMESVADGAPGNLAGHLRQLLSRRGKRVRSTFLLLLAQAGRDFDLERAARVCAAVELIHLGSLIHDDIIDGSDLRRNEKTAHQRWGNRVAVLLGDYTMSKSMELVWGDPDRRIPLSLSRASSALIRAEMLEVERAGRMDLTLEQYDEIIAGKTAALFETCGECGALLADFAAGDVARAARLGRDFGLAFQIIDDLLDFGIGNGDLDKRTFSDVKNGLLTLPLILYLNACGEEEKAEMLALLETSGEEPSQRRIREALEGHDAFGMARAMAEEKVRDGLSFIETLPDSPATHHLRQVCSLMTERSL